MEQLRESAVLTVSAHAAMPNHTSTDVHITVDPGVASCEVILCPADNVRNSLRVFLRDVESFALRLSLVLTARRYPFSTFWLSLQSYFGILGHVAAVDLKYSLGMR
jgi:hypothetical protein